MSTAEAQSHIGETATVCGKVVASRASKYNVTRQGRPTFLDLDAPEPNPAFIVVTWQPVDAKNGHDNPDYQGKNVCATGKITKARGIPQIIVSQPGQLKLQPDEQK